MKRFLLFIGHCYYPNGGMDDFWDSFDTLEQAMDFKKELLHNFRKNKQFIDKLNQSFYYINDGDVWWHIYDCQKMEIVSTSYE